MGRHSAAQRGPSSLSPYATIGAVLTVVAIAIFVVAKNTSEWAMAPGELFLADAPHQASDRTADTYHLFGIPMDFQVYYRAGECVLEQGSGCDVYGQNFVTENNGQRWDLPFTYPPLAAWGFAQLARVPMLAAAELWQIASLLALGVLIAACLRERRVHLSLAHLPFIVAVSVAAFVFAPVRGGFFWGQINLLIAALVAIEFLSIPALRAGAPPVPGPVANPNPSPSPGGVVSRSVLLPE